MEKFMETGRPKYSSKIKGMNQGVFIRLKLKNQETYSIIFNPCHQIAGSERM